MRRNSLQNVDWVEVGRTIEEGLSEAAYEQMQDDLDQALRRLRAQFEAMKKELLKHNVR